MVSISACHAGDRGSIPRQRVFFDFWMLPPPILLFTCFLVLFTSTVQSFDFFGDLFGGGGQRSSQGHQNHSQSSDSNETCLKFECPVTGECVDSPLECKCPSGRRKCFVGDWYICAPGNEACPVGTSEEERAL